MDLSLRAWSRLLTIGALVGLLAAVFAGAAIGLSGDDTPVLQSGVHPSAPSEKLEELIGGDDEFVSSRTAGDNPLDVTHAGQLQAKAMQAAKKLGKPGNPSGPQTFNSAWTACMAMPLLWQICWLLVGLGSSYGEETITCWTCQQ